MRWVLAAAATVALVQALVWLGSESAPARWRAIAMFGAPICLLLMVLALASTRIPALLF